MLPNLFPFYPSHTNLIGFWDIKKLFWYVAQAFDVPPKFLMFRFVWYYLIEDGDSTSIYVATVQNKVDNIGRKLISSRCVDV